MIEQLKDLKDIFESARAALTRNREPLEDFIKLNACLKAVVDEPKLIFEKMDNEYRKFFFDTLAGGAMKSLTREKSNDEKYLQVIADILENYLRLFLTLLNLGQYIPVFFDSVKYLFDYDSLLHSYNYQISEDELKRIRTLKEDWRLTLAVGDMIDAIVDEPMTRCSGWGQARIAQVNGDTMLLEFIYDSKTADRYLDRWSVEIAQFETKTKELFEWKKTIAIGTLVDCNDKTTWNKSTVLDVRELQVATGRTAMQAFIGYRVYQENGPKSDEKGTFDGWSNRFDEWISIYSPRIQPYLSKTQRQFSDDQDLDDNFDQFVTPAEGQTRVYVVPRIRKCTSSLFIKLLNLFGNQGGFDLVLKSLQQDDSAAADSVQPDFIFTKMDLNLKSILVTSVATPYLIYHKDFIAEYAPKFVDVATISIRNAPDNLLRDVRRERIESLIKSIDNFLRRIVPKAEREKQIEVLKLEVSLICLNSSYLERRIQGIKDLNSVIRSIRLFNSKSFTPAFLLDWLEANQVLSAVVLDPRRTHLQLVQRCGDVMKLMLQEEKMGTEIMGQLWALTKVEYKFEIYKIINEIAVWFKQEHIEFFFIQITQQPPEKMGMEDFQVISELGKYSKDADFKNKVTSFFWNIICDSELYKDDLVQNCLSKFCEMVKSWEMNLKHRFFVDLTQNLRENRSSVASLKLFKGLIKDQKEKFTYTYGQQASAPTTATTNENGEAVPELTLALSLLKLIQQEKLIEVLLTNLSQYCQDFNAKLQQTTEIKDRKKLFVVNTKYSHNDEIDERLQFLKYIALVSTDYQISKSELETLYELLVTKSQIPTDNEEFLIWCKSSCEQSTSTNPILDLNEVGGFFTEKMKNGSLDLKNLIQVGFDFLQQYFLSVNEQSEKLIKAMGKTEEKAKSNYTYGQYGMYGLNIYGGYGPAMRPVNNLAKKVDSKAPAFKILKNPQDLDQLDIVWNIALFCENPALVPKAIDFLIKVYYNLDNDLDQQRTEIQDALIAKCMTILKEASNDAIAVRVLEIIKRILSETERKGTANVKPHNSLLKGELLDRVNIKNRASPNVSFLIISIYSNTTFWDFKQQVAVKLGLAPKYLKLQKSDGKAIKEIENGKTLAQLGFSATEQLTAFKINIEEQVPNAPLVGTDGKLTERASKIFNEWFDMYSDENDRMTPEFCALFIKGCTGEHPTLTDDRIVNMFNSYDSNKDGVIERYEFINFYEIACRNKGDTVRENLRHHNIRADLKKLSEVKDVESFQAQDMPRLKISKNQEYFDQLMSLLDRSGPVSESAWNLIQMLATNPEIYTKVLQLESAYDKASGKVDWSKFFDSHSVYRLLYTLQIVEAVMEEGEGEGLERFDIVDDTVQKKAANIPVPPPLPGSGVVPPIQVSEPLPAEPEAPVEDISKKQVSIVDESEDRILKQEWTNIFLNGNGFEYVLNQFMSKTISREKGDDQRSLFELKHIAFLLKLLRIFIMAAFSTSAAESSVYASANLVRKSSSTQEESKETQQDQGSRFKQLQNLLAGPAGELIISNIDYQKLLQKILTLISQVLHKDSMIFEDKLIIENALSLLVGCILHKVELLNDFYKFTSSSIHSCDEFVLTGLLFCPEDKIREEFKLSLGCLARKVTFSAQSQGVKEPPLFYLLRLLSSNFSLISKYQCKQFFELFCDLIDLHFIMKSLESSSSSQAVFDAESLLSQIIDQIKDYNHQAKSKQSLALTIIDNDSTTTLLQQQTSTGRSRKASNEDKEAIYIGLIQLMGKLFDNFDIRMSERLVEQKNLIEEIFVHFLFASVFDQQSQEEVEVVKKIKPKRLYGETDKSQEQSNFLGKKSKDAAYRLLNNLIRKSPLLMNAFLEKSMLPLMAMIKRHNGWNYQPPSASADGRQKYVGLKNLGAVCYMNSMNQQFFMIPAFRYNLLSVDDGCPEDLVEYKNTKVDDNMIHQFQKMMAHLELSERTDYNPFEYCFAFKDLDGNPTNTGEQKDAQEYLNLSFDRIENLLRATSRKYLLQSVFGGQTCSQVVCLECGTCKNRIEDFYNLSLTVKDIKSMSDSLQKLIEGEVINDYECDTCKKKVDISKRILLSQTPNVLIVHLQRIIFNFDTFRNDKINTFFEFPTHLDLKPYSFYEVMRKEGRLKKKTEANEDEDTTQKADGSNTQAAENQDNLWPEEDDCWEYKLVGVTVHSGTANAGHYWSYINTRRGHAEPDAADPAWAATESDPWMEFNDSTVRTFNFEKLKEECYGGDGKSGNVEETSGWGGGGFGGSYGKSAYMLVYERRKKKPVKILLTPEEAKEMPAKEVYYDEKKEEYYTLVDYKTGVEEIAPSKIYRQVFEDNQKFEFDNDIYSQEFFEFVKGVLTAVSLQQGTSDLHSSVKEKALQVGKKTVMDLLAKCFHNSLIKPLCETLIDIMKKDTTLCATFLRQCFAEDNCNYLMEIILECTDLTARQAVANLVKFIVGTLRDIEGDQLFDMEKITTTNEKGETSSVEQPASLCAQFIMKCLSLLNTQVAKNWARFENFLEIILTFACGEEEQPNASANSDEQKKQPVSTKGLEYLMSVNFVEKACDFMLGKKSPLCGPGEKRIEMGGSFTQPNFTALIKLLTSILTNESLIEKHPLSDIEKKMFLNAELLKVMLSSQTGGKQFGQCLANMCRDNIKMSQKVSKVFIKAINNSNFDNIKSYLTALKPFLKLQDSLKSQRLEWIFGFSQIVSRKGYQQERYQYGFEHVQRIGEECYTYISPVNCSVGADEPLLAQLLKCKGKLDTFAINCLKEMLSLMSKDEEIARYVYNAAPPTYQSARYSDWIRPYLEYQKADMERTNLYSYNKQKYDNILKSLEYLDRFEQHWVSIFRKEEEAKLEEAMLEPSFVQDVQKDYLAFDHKEVIEHYPPQLIIGKQTQDEKDCLVYDEDPLVKVTLSEVTCEYNYSNPTMYFNLSIPHIELKTNAYTLLSYSQWKTNEFEAAKKAAAQEAKEAAAKESSAQEDGQAEKDPQEAQVEEPVAVTIEERPALVTRNWFDCKREGVVLLKVSITCKVKRKVKVALTLTGGENVILPKSPIKEIFFDTDTKVVLHLQKIDPTKLGWGNIRVEVKATEKAAIPAPPKMHMPKSFKNGPKLICNNCDYENDVDDHICDKCHEKLNSFEFNVVQSDYFGV